MDLAIWDYPPAEFLVSGFTSGAVANPFRIARHRPEQCAAMLVEDEVDVALMPTMLALQASSAIDVLPSVGLVSWRYPYARLVWTGGLHDFPDTIAYDRRVAQERIATRIVLHEHYQVDPTFVPYDDRPPTALLGTDEDAALLVGPNVPSLQPEPFTMDIGREWYELSNYPMVWGLYVTKRDRSTDEMIEALIASGEAADENRDVWVQAQETTASLNEFYREDLSFGSISSTTTSRRTSPTSRSCTSTRTRKKRKSRRPAASRGVAAWGEPIPSPGRIVESNSHVAMAEGIEVVARNKKAQFEYDIEETLEAGLVLEGSEVKSIRQGKASLDGAYCQVDREGEMKIHGMYIKPYEEAGPFGHEPRRSRKLLLHDQQIQKWGQMADREGYTIVPLSLYFRDGWAKLKLGIAKGRQKHDKRQAIKEREMERRMEQQQSEYNF